MARSGSPVLAATRARISIGYGSSRRVFFDRIRSYGPLRECQRGSLVTEAHIGQREIPNERIIFWLVFEKRIPVRCEPAAKFPGRRHDRRQLLAPSLTKSAVRH